MEEETGTVHTWDRRRVSGVGEKGKPSMWEQKKLFWYDHHLTRELCKEMCQDLMLHNTVMCFYVYKATRYALNNTCVLSSMSCWNYLWGPASEGWNCQTRIRCCFSHCGVWIPVGVLFPVCGREDCVLVLCTVWNNNNQTSHSSTEVGKDLESSEVCVIYQVH